MFQSVTHLALRVQSLREAEAYYVDLFGLEVAWREAETAAGWQTLPYDKSWQDAEKAGVQLGLVMLEGAGLSLALEAVEQVSPDGTLSHVGILVSEADLTRLREYLAQVGTPLVHDHPRTIVFDDRYGVRWELTTKPYTDAKAMSSGARTGAWLEV